MDNSTLNLVNIEITALKVKQKIKSLDIIEMKKLESLIRMRKDIITTPEVKDVYEEVDEEIFTDEEILQFLAERKASINEQVKEEKVKSKASKKKTNKKAKKKISKR